MEKKRGKGCRRREKREEREGRLEGRKAAKFHYSRDLTGGEIV